MIRENTSGSLMTQFLTQVRGIDKAAELVVSIDGKEMFRFTPEVRDHSEELPGVAAYFDSDQGAVIIERLRKTANGAKWLQVEAPPYNKVVPAQGLEQAIDDLGACRTATSL